MAEITGLIDRNLSESGAAALLTWSGLTFNTLDTGAPVQWVDYADRCAQVTGVFGVGGAVVLEGSNDGVVFNSLADPQGNSLVFSSGKLEQVLELPRYVRPRVIAGDASTNLTVTICLRKVRAS